uniref:Uncharacterized protein n=1 Tax=Oryza punctata TaxID=4537 RepID=A0A0E0MM03_ORYPU
MADITDGSLRRKKIETMQQEGNRRRGRGCNSYKSAVGEKTIRIKDASIAAATATGDPSEAPTSTPARSGGPHLNTSNHKGEVVGREKGGGEGMTALVTLATTAASVHRPATATSLGHRFCLTLPPPPPHVASANPTTRTIASSSDRFGQPPTTGSAHRRWEADREEEEEGSRRGVAHRLPWGGHSSSATARRLGKRGLEGKWEGEGAELTKKKSLFSPGSPYQMKTRFGAYPGLQSSGKRSQRRRNTRTPFMKYLKNGWLPEDEAEAKRLQIRATKYKLVSGQLYLSRVRKWRKKYTRDCAVHTRPAESTPKTRRRKRLRLGHLLTSSGNSPATAIGNWLREVVVVHVQITGVRGYGQRERTDVSSLSDCLHPDTLDQDQTWYGGEDDIKLGMGEP